MKSKVSSVVAMLRNDKRYKRLLSQFNTLPVFNIPVETLVEEITQIHEMRAIRRLDASQPGFIDAVVNANTHDQAQRSRLTAISMRCIHVTSKLKLALDNLRNYYLLEYSDHLRQFRTKEERALVMRIALKKFHTYIDQVAYVRELALQVVSDVDKGGYSLKTTVEALKVHVHREVQI